MIIDARAINYETMLNFSRSGKLRLSAPPEDGVQALAIISITDFGIENIFPEDTKEIIQLKFADADPCDVTTPDGKFPELMTTDQAIKIFNFIEKIHKKPKKYMIVVNCMMGMCRSGAIVDYIANMYGLGFHVTRQRNPIIIPNYWVRFKLMEQWFKNKQQK